MNKYFKNIEDNYIISISTGTGQEEISQEEYQNILNLVHSRPEPLIGFDYKLRTDLTWELVVESTEPEETAQ